MKPKSILAGIGAACALLVCAAAFAEPYRPQQAIEGDIRIWGSPDDAQLILLWDSGFRKHHPHARVVAALHGPESTMAGIYTDVADIAFIGRELRLPVESMAFEWVKLHKPATIEVANAALHVRRVAANLAVFVHPDNPIAGLTLQQLEAVYGARLDASARNWGDLGLDGTWRDRPIHVLGPRVDSVDALFFRKAVLDGSFKWNPQLREIDSDARIVDAVLRDPDAIAYAPLAAAPSDGLRAVPLAVDTQHPFVPLTAVTAADRSYPLARAVYMAYDRTPGQPIEPRVREFLRYVLSDEGQADIARNGAYVPLASPITQRQLRKLD